MTKVGTITFHHACNNGAVLQAYALVEYLNSIANVEAEIIDYRCVKIHDAYQPAFCFYNCGRVKGLIKYLLRYRSIVRRNQKFCDFSAACLKVSPRRYDRASIHEAADNYDYIISGSDQIWNYELTGGDLTYLLDFVTNDSKKISYAASLGIDRIEECRTEQYRELIGKYRSLSVRESRAGMELEQIAGCQAAIHIDPVFLLGEETWKEMAVRPKAKHYILYYMVGMGRIVDESIKFAKALSKQTGLLLVFLNSEHIPYLYPDIRHIKTISPDEYLGWILNAEYVVTNSFHATCFSIIFEKICYSEVDCHKGERIANLLHICGLESNTLHKGKPGAIQVRPEDAESPPHLRAAESIDWQQVKDRLAVSIKESKNYLINAVGSGKSPSPACGRKW